MVTAAAAKAELETEKRRTKAPWPTIRLTDVARLESGHTPSKRRPDYWNGTIQWLSLHDVDALEDMRIYATAKTVTPEGIENSSARILPAGTVAFSRTATVGKAVILGVPMATSQDFACYVCGPNVHNEFLVHLFRSMGRDWKKLMAGSIHNTIYMPVFRELELRLPPLVEQRALAEALSDADALIESLEALIAKKRAIKQGAMQDLLSGRKRLAGFSGKWVVQTLGNLFTFKNGLNKEKSAFGAGTPIINYMDVFSFPHINAYSIKGKVTLTPTERENFSVRKGDVFFTRTSETVEEIGLAAVLIDEIEDAVFSGFVLRARPARSSLDDLFTGYALRSEQVRRQIMATASYTTRALTNGRLLSAVTLAMPPHDEQVAIGETLLSMDTEIGNLEAKVAKARQIKKGMMQELLTGRVRLA